MFQLLCDLGAGQGGSLTAGRRAWVGVLIHVPFPRWFSLGLTLPDEVG
jgi:hypothetical protein